MEEMQTGSLMKKAVINIIIADQQKHRAQANKRLLEEEGMFVMLADTSLDVLALTLELNPHYLIVDRHLSVLDGFQLSTLLGSRKETSNIKIILMSDQLSVYEQIKFEALKIHALLLKPFGKAELLQALNETEATVIESKTFAQAS